MRRRKLQNGNNNGNGDGAAASADLKNSYRCSLINLEETKDEELDAILGELSVLGSRFDDEIAGMTKKNCSINFI